MIKRTMPWEKKSMPSVVGAWTVRKSLNISESWSNIWSKLSWNFLRKSLGAVPCGNERLPVDQLTARGALREHTGCGHWPPPSWRSTRPQIKSKNLGDRPDGVAMATWFFVWTHLKRKPWRRNTDSPAIFPWLPSFGRQETINNDDAPNIEVSF